MELVILAIVAGLSFATWALWKQGRAAERESQKALDAKAPVLALPEGDRTIHNLQPGDIVTHLGTDYLVEGALTLNDDGRVTRLYRLADGARTRWLAARPGDDSPLFLEQSPDVTVDANGPESIECRGLPYRLAARESPVATAAGSVGARPAPGRVQLLEYVGAGAGRILALVAGATVDAWAGERIAPHFVELLPGRGVATQ
jgi:hypothetical protein